METTTSSDKTYFFYLEVNSTNYKNICSFIPYTLKYKGYKWKQLQSSSDCTSSSNYPITDNTDSSQKITFPVTKNSFLIPSEVSGTDTPSLKCSSQGSTTFVASTSGLSNTTPYSKTVTCSGKEDCSTFFPPAKLTYKKENF